MTDQEKLEVLKAALQTISDWNKTLKSENISRDVAVGMWRECIKISREALKEIEE